MNQKEVLKQMNERLENLKVEEQLLYDIYCDAMSELIEEQLDLEDQIQKFEKDLK